VLGKKTNTMKLLAFVFLALIGTTQAGVACDVCEDLISFVDSLLQNNEQNIESKAIKYCNDLGFFSSMCDSLVKKYLPQVVADLKNGDDQQKICNVIGRFCEQEEKKMPQFLHFNKCTLCEELLKIISLVGGRKEPAIEHAVDSVCNYLGLFKKDCINLVHEYVPKLIDALGEGKTEEEACSYVGMCSSKKAVAKTVAKPVVNKQTKGFECSLCEALVGFIDSLLKGNEGDIKQKVNEYCNDLPVFGSTCTSIVDKYLDKIIQYLKDGQDQKYICNEIGGFCQEASYVAAQKAFAAHVKGQTKGVTCDICDEVCKWIEDYGVDKGLDAIEHYVDGKCDDIPFIGHECKDLVNKWLGKLVGLLKKDLPPKKVCEDVDLC
jgi:hypothetical protein